MLIISGLSANKDIEHIPEMQNLLKKIKLENITLKGRNAMFKGLFFGECILISIPIFMDDADLHSYLLAIFGLNSLLVSAFSLCGVGAFFFDRWEKYKNKNNFIEEI